MNTAAQTTALRSRNASWGFYGTVAREGDDAHAFWMEASRQIAEATDATDPNAYGPEAVRDFLDSRNGRHFANSVLDALNHTGEMTAAIAAAITEHQGWKISRRDQREHGIPAGLPFLTGWVQHCALEAEGEAEGRKIAD